MYYPVNDIEWKTPKSCKKIEMLSKCTKTKKTKIAKGILKNTENTVEKNYIIEYLEKTCYYFSDTHNRKSSEEINTNLPRFQCLLTWP